MEPILLDIPTERTTARLLLRVPRPGDGALIFPSIRESLPELKPWMPWAVDSYSESDAELWVRRAAAAFHSRERIDMLIFLRDSGRHIGTTGFPRLNWTIPMFEIGYWLGTNFTKHGFMTEAVLSLTNFAFQSLEARRVMIQCDERNMVSRRVAERAGFQLEGTLRNDERTVGGVLRNTCIYAVIANPQP